MKALLTSVSSAVLLAASAAAQTLPLYENYGFVREAPQIDAVAFANYGLFSIATTLPFDFENTINFTNRGTMIGRPGFRFATASTATPPFKPAAAFVNEVGGTITATDVAGLLAADLVTADGGTQVPGESVSAGGFSGQLLTPSYLLLSADTIANKGYLIAGAAGLLQVKGKNVDLSRSGVGIARIELSSTFSANDTNYVPDPGIYDSYWGITNQFDMRVAPLLSITAKGTNATSPRHEVTNSVFSPFGIPTTVAVSITNPTTGLVSLMTNVGGADPETGRVTNIYRQAVFVQISDTNFTMNVKWAPSNIATNPYQTPIIEFAMLETNVITGDVETNTLYLLDTLASGTNYTLLMNRAANPTTFIPGTYALRRSAPPEFRTAAAGKGTLTNTFFFNPADTNFVAIVTNLFAGYSAQIESLASRPPAVSGLEITQFPGRVEIDADNLDLTKARLRGTALISIETPNLVASQGVNVDSENVRMDLAVPDGKTLNVEKVIKEQVVRLNGSLRSYSAIWTNFFGVKATNQVEEPAGSGTMTNVVTNLVTEIDCHVLIVDATGLKSTKAVTTHDFVVHADSVVVSDPTTVVRTFVADTDKLTLNARLTLTGAITNWSATNAPRLKSFANKGVFTVTNTANFGQDLPNGYDSFANSGVINASGIKVRAGSFENSGGMTSRVDGIVIQTQTARFESNTMVSARDLALSGNNLRFHSSTNRATGRLILSATDSLSDSGDFANNVFEVRNGFQLPYKPASGDLLGTTLQSIAPRFARVEHLWAGADLGVSSVGFQNNVAIGRLILGGDRDVQLSFTGTGEHNGMYVEQLDLTGALTNAVASGDLTSALSIDPNLTIYFANSNVPADQLEKQSEGRLRKVPAAASSSFVQVAVRSSGETVSMQRAVRESTTLDSDGDGIVNAYDAYPLDQDNGVRLNGSKVAGATSIALSWQAAARTSYVIEFTASLQDPKWETLSTFTNPDGAAQVATFRDQMIGEHAERYYRIRAGQ